MTRGRKHWSICCNSQWLQLSTKCKDVALNDYTFISHFAIWYLSTILCTVTFGLSSLLKLTHKNTETRKQHGYTWIHVWKREREWFGSWVKSIFNARKKLNPPLSCGRVGELHPHWASAPTDLPEIFNSISLSLFLSPFSLSLWPSLLAPTLPQDLGGEGNFSAATFLHNSSTPAILDLHFKSEREKHETKKLKYHKRILKHVSGVNVGVLIKRRCEESWWKWISFID